MTAGEREEPEEWTVRKTGRAIRSIVNIGAFASLREKIYNRCNQRNLRMKRVFDLFASSLGIVVSFPIFAAISLLIMGFWGRLCFYAFLRGVGTTIIGRRGQISA